MNAARLRRMARGRTAQVPLQWHAVLTALRTLAPGASAQPAEPLPDSPVAHENSRPGVPPSVWDVEGAGDPSIQGFATDISVNVGDTVDFKIDTEASAYTIEIYRLGYYGGKGARKVADVSPSAALPQRQPPGIADRSVGLLDCGNWDVSASWAVPATAVSGVYIAKLTRADTGGASHIPFVVRDDASTAGILFQTADETWQAYNRYGGANFYTGSPTDMWDSATRARKVSYNRPFSTRGDSEGRDFLFSAEYPTIRFLERNGYDLTYVTGVDVHRLGANALRRHEVFLSVGHDEYWSRRQRENVEQALATGVHLMFLSGNEMYWRTRFEPSIDGSDTPNRTLVCYKDTWDGAATDPTEESTATWRDPRFLPPEHRCVPENAVTGTLFMANQADFPISVTAEQGKLRLWRGTALASMRRASTRLAPHTVGYESDEDVDNGFRPAGLIRLSTATGPSPAHVRDFGTTETVRSTTTHHLTLYRAGSGSLVFGAGTVQWGWGLDRHHDGTRGLADWRMQQATVNMLADMQVQPTTLMRGLVPATPPIDDQPPVSTITGPASGQLLANGAQVTVSGTAVHPGSGVVAGVEVSIDSGATWQPATGTTSWTYTGVIHGAGPVTISARATDDSANTEKAPACVDVMVVGPCTLFGSMRPRTEDSGDPAPAELGVRFSSTVDGYVTGIRFYKAPTNTGAHAGTLWSADGTRLATETFSGETDSGWQTLLFARPVAITADTIHVASYFAPNGHYTAEPNFFYYRDYNAVPLIAEATVPGRARANGVHASGHGFPSRSADGSNYYVEPIFSTRPGGDRDHDLVGAVPGIGLERQLEEAGATRR